MRFADALTAIEGGNKVRRSSWIGGAYVATQLSPDGVPFLAQWVGGHPPQPYSIPNVAVYATDWEDYELPAPQLSDGLTDFDESLPVPKDIFDGEYDPDLPLLIAIDFSDDDDYTAVLSQHNEEDGTITILDCFIMDDTNIDELTAEDRERINEWYWGSK